MIIDEQDYLAHYGILRKSGRYPWGSGDNVVSQKSISFLDSIQACREAGMSEVEIARGMGISTTELRAQNAIAKNEVKQAMIGRAQRLKDKGVSDAEGARMMGIPGTTYRALLAPGAADRADILTSTASSIKNMVDQKGLLDVGLGIENHIGVSKKMKDTAVAMLEEEGYKVHYLKTPQLGTGKDTYRKVLAPPGVTSKEVWARRDEVKTWTDVSEDNGRSWFGLKPPMSVDESRIGVAYKEDGGDAADGVIYVRPGVKDLDLGGSTYAQVRIKVGEDRYLKGMAVYKDDLPDGVDLVFNTNKSDTGNKSDAFKKLSDDPDNPFGAQLKRQLFDDEGNVRSAMNIVNEEGDWNEWSRSIASQVLSKQSPTLAKDQLRMSYERRIQEFENINSLTNPTVRKKLLEEFADGTDAAAVHLKAAALPRQRTQVILPVSGLKETEIYAPNFRPGESVALIRYPHGGTFEIPILTVNNRNPAAKRVLGNAKDAVGINPKTAERLSGADFDGDTVVVIPNNQGRIQSSPALEGLRGFDPKRDHAPYDGMRTIDGGTYRAATNSVDYGDNKPNTRRMQQEMGDVSNLITDMTIRGAPHSDIARAVRHSMVVIDSEKHHLNYRQSAIDNGIRELKAKYQEPYGTRGASTLISKAESPERVPYRVPRKMSEGGPVDRETGRRVYTEVGGTYVNKKGETVQRTTKIAKLANVDDARELSSGTPIETVYAEHSNRLKGLANEARRLSVNTPRAPYSPSAAKTYAKEVASLNSKLDLALRNAPLERQAQTLANAWVRAKKDANPNMDEATLKKIKSQALAEARNRTGARKVRVEFTQDEWNAIQAGAISDSKLTQILNNANMDVVRELATPRTSSVMTTAKRQRAEAMLAAGYPQQEIADSLGVSLSTLYNSIGSDQ